MNGRRSDPRDAIQLRSGHDLYLDMVGGELFELCRSLPPAASVMIYLDERMERRFAPWVPDMRPAQPALLLELCDLLTWELDHDVERIDHYLRNRGYGGCVHSQLEEETFFFLRHVLLERLLERQEKSARRVKRSELQRCLQVMRGLALKLGEAS